MGYAIRRMGYGVILLLAVSVFSFALLELAPGEFFDEMKMNPQISPETIGALRERYGLAASPVVRYLHWLQSAAQGDFGYSFAYNMPASSLLWARAGNTLLLTVPAMLMAWLVALPLGVWSALRQGGWVDRVCGAGSSALLTLPDLLVAMLFLLLALRTGWFPTGGMRSPAASDLSVAGRLGDLAFHALLPICALVAGLLPLVLRHVRASMIEVLDAPALRAARGHGIRQARVVYRYGLAMAANPLVSLGGLSVATLLSASLLVEVIMGWPGLGPLLLEAIFARDLHLVVGASLFSTTFLVAGNLLSDVLLFAADPRIRPE